MREALSAIFRRSEWRGRLEGAHTVVHRVDLRVVLAQDTVECWIAITYDALHLGKLARFLSDTHD